MKTATMQTIEKLPALTQVECDLMSEAAGRLAKWAKDTLRQLEVAGIEDEDRSLLMLQVTTDFAAAMAVGTGIPKDKYLQACALLYEHQRQQQGGLKP